MKIKVSIIVPVYNSEKYLPTCIDNLLKQNFDSYEIILIDDGSSDRSGAIIDEYATKNEIIRAYHKQNGGICSARNYGIDVANGEYIAFCDNDDLTNPNLLIDNYQLAKKYSANIVRFLREVSYENKGIKTYERPKECDELIIYDNKELFENMNKIMNSSVGIWCGLYEKAFLDEHNLRFNEQFKYGVEDNYFNLECYDYCKKLVFNQHIYYEWCQRDVHSTSKKFNENYLKSNQEAMELWYELANKHHLFKQAPGVFEDVMTNCYLIGFYERMLMPNCPYSMKQKINFLKKLKELKMFRNIDQGSLKAFKKLSITRYITYKLFLKNAHRLNFLIIKTYLKKMGRL